MADRPLPAPGTPLTRDERLVLAGIARGRITPQIATDLSLSTHTVRRHLARLSARMGCRGNRAHAVAIGYRTGVLTDLPPEPRIHPPLDRRHLAVLTGMADGLSNAEIGQQLGLSAHSIASICRTLFASLGATSRAHAVALGFQHGHLTAPEPTTTDQGGAAA